MALAGGLVSVLKLGAAMMHGLQKLKASWVWGPSAEGQQVQVRGGVASDLGDVRAAHIGRHHQVAWRHDNLAACSSRHGE